MAKPNAHPLMGSDLFELHPDSRERFLPIPHGHALQHHGVLGAGISERRTRCRMARRAGRRQHNVVFTRSGKGRVWLEKQHLVCGPGDFLLLPGGLAHVMEMEGPSWDVYWFHLARRHGVRERYCQSVRHRKAQDPLAMFQTMEAYISETQKGPCPVSEALANLLLAYLDRELAATDGAEGERERGMDAVWRKVHLDPSHPWRVPELSAMQGVTVRQFRRQCRALYGLEPRALLCDIRLAHARELLSYPEYTLDAVAARVGFAGPFILSQAFKRRVGESPEKWRGHLSGIRNVDPAGVSGER